MASSYPPPFEGTGEVKEGFICPLCHKDLQSFYQLQDHYEEEHSGDDRHVRGQLKSKCTACNICDYCIYVYLYDPEFSKMANSPQNPFVECSLNSNFFTLQNRGKWKAF